MRVTGNEEEWHIDFQNPVQQRFACVDELLGQYQPGQLKLWFNVAVGTRSPDSAVVTYCKTRYGMIGFSKAIELNPKFSGIAVQNICLSFFRFYQKHHEAEYCTNCTTLEQRQAMKNLADEKELVQYLVVESENRLLEKP